MAEQGHTRSLSSKLNLIRVTIRSYEFENSRIHEFEKSKFENSKFQHLKIENLELENSEFRNSDFGI